MHKNKCKKVKAFAVNLAVLLQKPSSAIFIFRKQLNCGAPDIWDSLDTAARANLPHYKLDAFQAYKQQLKQEGHEWIYDAEIILRGYIWDESEI